MAATPEIVSDYMIIADQTGVGRPIIDMLRLANLRVVPVTITPSSVTLCSSMEIG